MFKTIPELVSALGARIRARRLGLGWTQADAAQRAGISYSTWRRMEAQGKASIEDLVKAATALRCETEVEMLFPAMAATSMDELLAQQSRSEASRSRQRARAAARRQG